MMQFLVLIFCALAWAEPLHHVPLDQDDFGVDTPQVGSSVFDKIFSRLEHNQSRYDIPYPFAKLLERLAARGGDFQYTLFPFSRSLQRPVDLSYDPLLNPRLVLGAGRGSLVRGKFFLGYVKATDQLEVISYNDEAGRFEFQIVRDYSQSPHVYYVDRGKCLSCHQGQAPIFATGPWLDSTIGPMGRLVAARLGLPDSEKPDSARIAKMLFDADLGVQKVTDLDFSIREANSVAFDERIWVHGCGSSRECRLGLLLRTLAPSSRHFDEYFATATRVLENSALQSQKMYHSFISSTDMGLLPILRRESGEGGLNFQAVAENPSDILEMIGNIHRLEAFDNPATKRSTDLTRFQLADFRLLTFTYEDMILLNQDVGGDRLGEILFDLYSHHDPLFEPRAINKPRIMAKLLKVAGSSHYKEYQDWLEIPTPAKELLQTPLIPVFSERELNVFARNCHTCHASGLSFPPQFLLGSEADVKSHIFSLREKILFKLKNHLMPPSAEAREALESSGDLAILLNYLEGLKTASSQGYAPWEWPF